MRLDFLAKVLDCGSLPPGRVDDDGLSAVGSYGFSEPFAEETVNVDDYLVSGLGYVLERTLGGACSGGG